MTPTKYCDLVMKGGITSGIVYPNAVLALAKEFRFKNIGGTSAGAIAAAASAAAAMGDRRKLAGSPLAHPPGKTGFEGLAQVSAQLSSAGFIYSLFQPARGVKNAYRLVVILAGNAGALRKLSAALIAVVAIAPLETLGLLGVFLALGCWAAGTNGIWATLLPSLLCAYLGGAVAAVLRVARVARRNLLGLCSGLSVKRFGLTGSTKPGLTEWLHTVLQELSGKPLEEPLTFADLWAADRYPDEPQTEKAINLQMITTGVSHHEPRTLPFTGGRFWFRREEFDLLFPKILVDWMVAQAGAPVKAADGVQYYKLPFGGKLPVLVGMRMSLSFPLLISAVPLHEPEKRNRKTEERPEAAENSVAKSADALATGGDQAPSRITAFRVCWFSDGGISSNFPIHLFDAPLPLWPTFAINLRYPKTDDSKAPPPAGTQGAVFLPTENRQGWQRIYQPIARTLALGEIVTFLFGIIATMQNWRDLLQSRAPGHRDRIVHISLTGTEGGMNLNMSQATLDGIAKKGTDAGELLKTFSFANHYWIRWRVLASALQRYTKRVAASEKAEPKIPDYRDVYEMPKSEPPIPPSYKFSKRQRDEAQKLLECLITKGQEWEDLGPDLTATSPRPRPHIQIIPTY